MNATDPANTLQRDLFRREAGDAGADEGIRKSAQHAEQDAPGWSVRATAMLVRYITERGGEFIAPEVRDFAHAHGLDVPPTNFAWGGVFRHAACSGLIVRAGYRQHGDEKMHTQSVAVWRGA